MNISSILEMSNPTTPITVQEFNTSFTRFCTFVSIIYNKKLGYPGIFHYLVKNPSLFDLYKKMCVIDNDIQVIRTFIGYDPSIYKSKVIKKYITDFAKKKYNITNGRRNSTKRRPKSNRF